MEITSGVRSLGLLPPVALGPMNPVRWNLPKILLTQPLETCTEHTVNPTCWYSHEHMVKWEFYSIPSVFWRSHMVSRPRSRAQSSVSVYRRAEDDRSETHRPADSHSLPLTHIHTQATLLGGYKCTLLSEKKRYKTGAVQFQIGYNLVKPIIGYKL